MQFKFGSHYFCDRFSNSLSGVAIPKRVKYIFWLCGGGGGGEKKKKKKKPGGKKRVRGVFLVFVSWGNRTKKQKNVLHLSEKHYIAGLTLAIDERVGALRAPP
jgi:hypothetical protein